uniref:Uncharacterized protein n=1 Tax=Romanomermis culicivorax TaxID=13658 RepID=A0A915LBD3_ROMCU
MDEGRLGSNPTTFLRLSTTFFQVLTRASRDGSLFMRGPLPGKVPAFLDVVIVVAMTILNIHQPSSLIDHQKPPVFRHPVRDYRGFSKT